MVIPKQMSLPHEITAFLTDGARRAGVNNFQPDDDLFALGVLDSFSLVDLVSVIEQTLGVTVPDSDVQPANFRTAESIQHYLGQKR